MTQLIGPARRSMTSAGLIKVTVTITAEQDRLLDEFASRGQVSRSYIVRQVIEDGLKVQRVKQAAGDAAVEVAAS
jgi:predicted transcriptional regulator